MHVDTVDEAHLPGAAGHYQRLRTDAVAEEAHALEQRSIGYTGSGEDDVLAGSKVFGAIDLLHILDSHLGNASFQLRLIDYQAGNDFSVQAAHRCCGNDALGGASSSHYGMDACPHHRSSDAGREVAVADQLDACAGSPNLVDEFLVPGSVEDDNHQVLHVAIEALGDHLEVVLHGSVEIDAVLARRTHDQLLHVAIRSVQQSSAL